MSGIAGIISKLSFNENCKKIENMKNIMLHEQFYDSGIYSNQQLGLNIGWVTQNNSFSDCMPVYNETKKITLFFIGENYIDKDVIRNLKSKGHTFDESKAHYIVHLYEEMGDLFFHSLNGFFAGMLVDLEKKSVILFNDRFGMKRIYIFEDSNEFLFSTEAKSILKVKPELRNIDPGSLGEYFGLGCVVNNRTLFPRIHLLPGGSKWTFINFQCIIKEKYFDESEWEHQSCLAQSPYYKKLKDTFQRILPRYLNPEKEIAVSLTGGLDTRMIMAYIPKSFHSFNCYTFNSNYRDNFDVKISRCIAKICGLPHFTLHLNDDFSKKLPELIRETIYLTDGTLNINGTPVLYMNRLARCIAPIRITGNYGSELIRKLSTFKFNPPQRALFTEEINTKINEAEKIFGALRMDNLLSYILFNQIPWYHYGMYALENSQLTVRSPYMDNDFIKILYQQPYSLAIKNILLNLISDGNRQIAKITTDRGIKRNSNLFVSIARRFHYDILFKMEYYYSYGMPQWLSKLNYVFEPLQIDKHFLGWHKYYHLRPLFKNMCPNFLRDILLDRKTIERPYFDSKVLKKMTVEHIRGYSNYTNEINAALSTEMICRSLLEEI